MPELCNFHSIPNTIGGGSREISINSKYGSDYNNQSGIWNKWYYFYGQYDCPDTIDTFWRYLMTADVVEPMYYMDDFINFATKNNYDVIFNTSKNITINNVYNNCTIKNSTMYFNSTNTQVVNTMYDYTKCLEKFFLYIKRELSVFVGATDLFSNFYAKSANIILESLDIDVGDSETSDSSLFCYSDYDDDGNSTYDINIKINNLTRIVDSAYFYLFRFYSNFNSGTFNIHIDIPPNIIYLHGNRLSAFNVDSHTHNNLNINLYVKNNCIIHNDDDITAVQQWCNFNYYDE